MIAVEKAVLDDLVDFAALEVASGDLEPWAALLAELAATGMVTSAEADWLVKLYNAYDALGSAWSVYRRWPSLAVWREAADRNDAALYPCTQERRGLRGGRVIHHLASYADHALPDPVRWLRAPVMGDHPGHDFLRLTLHLRSVWGVGRQSAFEWAEFAAKVCGVPVAAADAQLWESEGPRRSLQRLYGNPRPTAGWLSEAGVSCRSLLADAGVALSWEDFETVICDFNVMRDGRYYPGRHLAALREEIAEVPGDDGELLLGIFARVVPSPWSDIAPGIDKAKLGYYRDTGLLWTTP